MKFIRVDKSAEKEQQLKKREGRMVIWFDMKNKHNDKIPEHVYKVTICKLIMATSKEPKKKI